MPFIRPPNLRKLMEDPGYWDDKDPRHPELVQQVSEQFAQAAEPKTRDAVRSAGELPQDIDAPDFEDRLFDHYLARLGPREGGKWNDRNRGAGLTYKGITKGTISRLRKSPETDRWRNLSDMPTELSDEKISEIYREEYFAKSRAAAIASMPGLIERTPELPEQLFDSGVQQSPVDAIRFLQEALDQTLPGSDLRSQKDGRPPSYDGIVGPKTYSALRRALAEGKLDEVNDHMVEIRFEDIKKGENYREHPELREGLENRAKSFLTSRRKERLKTTPAKEPRQR